MYGKQEVYQFLKENQISHEIKEHNAVFTIDEVKELGIDAGEVIAKNLFLRNPKGDRHFLVVVTEDKRVDLKKLAECLHSGKLSFASEERLMKYLGLTKGSVSPFGILNDTEKAVEVIFDRDLHHVARFGVHPNDNTASVFLAVDDLEKIITSHGNLFQYLTI